ncbi:hypothetical protein EIN_374330 [Entamoeba invadens IP1]|uniref:DUF4870 domain-containing protein n=1 Tax=Entamoeba invadens IP1 TaxID=370355 RepID=A0A0A1TVW0_ENTIV|nr:hypothetical protein EIN_374330 [Entamoeba invadens IP1]ELP83418.1 hypothetical protein EIN_374330 [Entamoeba invadens IP1]|eukprot:XP_004182764.1 hypothetical protein EIN_374330 [Entamoeba invadens IP1]
MADSQNPNPFDDGYTTPEPQDKSLPCSITILAILSTALGFVGPIIIFFLEKKNQYIRLVACHSALWHFILDLLLIIIALFLFFDHWFTYTLFAIYLLLFILFSIFLIVMAYFRVESGEAFLIPGISIIVKYLENNF